MFEYCKLSKIFEAQPFMRVTVACMRFPFSNHFCSFLEKSQTCIYVTSGKYGCPLSSDLHVLRVKSSNKSGNLVSSLFLNEYLKLVFHLPCFQEVIWRKYVSFEEHNQMSMHFFPSLVILLHFPSILPRCRWWSSQI